MGKSRVRAAILASMRQAIVHMQMQCGYNEVPFPWVARAPLYYAGAAA